MLLLKNKKAYYDYQLDQKYKAGIVLSGAEVKSLRLKHGSLAGSYIKAMSGKSGKTELFLINAQINAYRFAGQNKDYDPKRSRKLLLKRKEIEQLVVASEQKSYSIVPLAFLLEHNKIKLELALGRGKKSFEKREDIKKRDLKRELNKKLKQSQIKI
jgi:SsrA-binding protein